MNLIIFLYGVIAKKTQKNDIWREENALNAVFNNLNMTVVWFQHQKMSKDGAEINKKINFINRWRKCKIGFWCFQI
jgi:hypothetical protein